jgi:predicted RNase H-like nuclease
MRIGIRVWEAISASRLPRVLQNPSSILSYIFPRHDLSPGACHCAPRRLLRELGSNWLRSESRPQPCVLDSLRRHARQLNIRIGDSNMDQHRHDEELLDDHRDASVVAVDIPIGLPVSAGRRADALARSFVGQRRSSVFSTPPRSVLEAISYEDALVVTRDLGIAGISKQSFGLAPKILEVDEIARSDERVFEVHPEVSFRGMAGQPLKYSKKSWNGASRRRLLLVQHDLVLPENLGEAGLAPVDDVLDAAAAAWSADRIARGKALSLPSPPEQVEDGRLAAIWY